MSTQIRTIEDLRDIKHGSHVIKMIDDLFDEIYLVGGAVRNELMGVESTDLDFAVPVSPDDIVRKLSNAGLKTKEYAREFATINTSIADFTIQITSYRSESYSRNDRRPSISPITDIDSDLSRRDFTFNAMAVSRNEFIDPYDGEGDIERKLIKSVGDAEQKINEDPLRILRAYRFVSSLGFTIDKELGNCIKNNLRNMQSLSQERISDEFKKIISGNYWTDTLYEMTEAGALNEILSLMDLRYKITSTNLTAVLDRYSLNQLVEMSPESRIALLILIIEDSERGRGIKTTDKNSVTTKIVESLSIQRAKSSEILSALNKLEIDRPRNTIQDLQDEYDSLNPEDTRSLIVFSKLCLEKGYEALRGRSYHKAFKLFKSSLDTTEKSFGIIQASGADTDEQHFKLNRTKTHYLDRLSLLITANIMKDSLYLRHRTTSGMVKDLSKTYRIYTKRLSSADIITAIEEAIVKTYRIAPNGLSLENFDAFVLKNSNGLNDDRKKHLVQRYYYEQLKDKSASPSSQSDIYKKIANLRKDEQDGKPDLSYYDPYIDSLFMDTLAARSIDKFWSRYDLLQSETDKYIRIATDAHHAGAAMKRANLNDASVLTHALTLVNTLNEKLDISRSIVANYKLAGPAYVKNAYRFKVYLDWFSFLCYLRDATTRANTSETLDRLRQSTSLAYEDIDEEYLQDKLHEIALVRDKARAVYGILLQLNESEGDSLADTAVEGIEALSSLKNLYQEELIEKEDAFRILRNWCLRDADASIEKIPLGLSVTNTPEELDEDLELIMSGESQTVEFKSSWSYSLHEKIKRTEISHKILSTITAFMNTNGGNLFIGVSDDQAILGLESSEFAIAKGGTASQKIDAIRQDIDEQFDKLIGTANMRYLDIRSKNIDDKIILILTVKPSSSPVYFTDKSKNKKFFIRSSASTRELNIEDHLRYVSERFSNYLNSNSNKFDSSE